MPFVDSRSLAGFETGMFGELFVMDDLRRILIVACLLVEGPG